QQSVRPDARRQIHSYRDSLLRQLLGERVDMEKIEDRGCFGGRQQVWQHASQVLGCSMRFAVYLPPQAETNACPVLYWLSGLTCSEQTFITKAGAQRYAAEHGLILVAPDTSPRGDDVPNDPAYDLGQGA